MAKEKNNIRSLEDLSESAKILYARTLLAQASADEDVSPGEVADLYVFMAQIDLGAEARSIVLRQLSRKSRSVQALAKFLEEEIDRPWRVPVVFSLIKDLIRISKADSVMSGEEKKGIRSIARAGFGARWKDAVDLCKLIVSTDRAAVSGKLDQTRFDKANAAIRDRTESLGIPVHAVCFSGSVAGLGAGGLLNSETCVGLVGTGLLKKGGLASALSAIAKLPGRSRGSDPEQRVREIRQSLTDVNFTAVKAIKEDIARLRVKANRESAGDRGDGERPSFPVDHVLRSALRALRRRATAIQSGQVLGLPGSRPSRARRISKRSPIGLDGELMVTNSGGFELECAQDLQGATATSSLPQTVGSISDIPSRERVGILRLMAWFAVQDGCLAEEELAYLRRAGEALRLQDPEVRDILSCSGTQSLEALARNVTTPWVRLGILVELLALAFFDGTYDARERAQLYQVARHLGLDGGALLAAEDAIAIEVADSIPEQPSGRAERPNWTTRRKLKVAGAAVAGLGALVVTGGLAAPAVGGALGAAMGLSGAAATSAGLATLGGGSLAAGGFGMAGGSAVISGLFGLTGAVRAGKAMARRTKGVDEFEMLGLRRGGARIILGVSGFLSQDSDFQGSWRGLLDRDNTSEILALRWESQALSELGKAFAALSLGIRPGLALTGLCRQATKKAGGILALPAAALAAFRIIDNPWSVARNLAVKTGDLLADTLQERSLGRRPVSLIGFSLGCRVILEALRKLADQDVREVISSVILLGGAADSAPDEWSRLSRTVSGAIVNGYCETDSILGYLYRAAEWTQPIGLGSLNAPGVLDVDLTSIVDGHLNYRPNMRTILDRVYSEAEDRGMMI